MTDNTPRIPDQDTAVHVFAGSAPDIDLRKRSSKLIPELFVADQRFSLVRGTITIGRSDRCDVIIQAAGVSREHARIVLAKGRITLEDLGSKNGTFVGSNRVDHSTEITHSCTIRLGPAWLVLHVPEKAEDY